MTGVVCWTDPGGCSTCKYCGMDMEMEPYCAHPKVTASSRFGYGMGINSAIQQFCGPDLKLREARE